MVLADSTCKNVKISKQLKVEKQSKSDKDNYIYLCQFIFT